MSHIAKSSKGEAANAAIYTHIHTNFDHNHALKVCYKRFITKTSSVVLHLFKLVLERNLKKVKKQPVPSSGYDFCLVLSCMSPNIEITLLQVKTVYLPVAECILPFASK